MKSLKVFLWACLFFLNPFQVCAGNLTPPAPPDDPGSAVYTLEDLWYRLSDGMIGEKRTGEFSEPVSGPGDYGHSIDDLMSIAPAPVSENSASPEDVPEGMTFWCLNPDDGKWGTQTGTMPVHEALNITPGAAEQSIPAGYYSEAGTVAGDANLVPGNIAGGISVFGVAGSALVAAGDAVPGDVLTGKTFSKTGAAGLTGTMPDNGAVTITPGTANQSIPAGYHNGAGTVAGDPNLASGNIRGGASIFGVTGSVIQASGNAAPADVLIGKTFSNNDAAGVSGTRYPFPVNNAGPAFTDNGDGTVTDNRTGLIWLKNANCTETVGGVIGGANYWAAAQTFCSNLENGKCGLSDGSAVGDWRLPKYNELNSLIDSSQYNLALPAVHPFSNVQASVYWSSTTYADGTPYAWHVNLISGFAFSGDKTMHTNYVWAVR